MIESTVVNDAVVPVKERWVYVIAETQDRKTGWEITQEAYVDDRGRYHRVTRAHRMRPLTSARSLASLPKHTVLFPKFVVVKTGETAKDSVQEPLWIRLLIAPFRLPSAATALLGQKFRDEIAEPRPPPVGLEEGAQRKITVDHHRCRWAGMVVSGNATVVRREPDASPRVRQTQADCRRLRPVHGH